MLFNEIYSKYFNLVAEVIENAIMGTLDDATLIKIVSEKGFDESIATVPDAIRNATWPIISSDWDTPILNVPTMPLTTLQKRWLKALLSDPRIKLFSPSISGLEDVEPLFSSDTFVYFDRYLDGDPFDNPKYIKNFRTILTAIKEKRKIVFHFESGKGKIHTWRRIPYKIEYSSKDDKFRVLFITEYGLQPVNISRIKHCSLLRKYEEAEYQVVPQNKNELVLELKDERNALERALLSFSDLDKETQKIGDDRYKLILRYVDKDVTEILIRVLSFGPVIKVIEPQSFVNLIKERLNKQSKY